MDRSPADSAPEYISPLSRRRGVALAGDRLSAAVERRPWTALAIALGVGVALAAATGGSDDELVADSPDDGDDYLAEYEDALVAGSPRWAEHGRDAVRGAAPAAGDGATHEDWRTGLRE